MATRPSGVSSPQLWLRTYTLEDATIVKCSGKLTAEVTGILKTEIKNLIPRERQIVLDLSDLSHMDSSGLGTLVGLYVSAKTGGCDLQLINLGKRVRELLGLTNVLSVFETCGKYQMRIP